MDESWRMSIGDGFAHNSSARRRSIEKDRRIRMNPDVVPADEDDDDHHHHHEDDDFLDVFGGPPRILRHRRSAAGFYKEVFSPPLAAAEATGTGRRNLPGFCIPPATNNNTSSSTSNRSLVRTEDGFYDDIFGSSHFIYTAAASAAVPALDRRSRSRSTTKSGSGNNCKSRSNSSSDRDSNTSYLINSHPRANGPRSSTIVRHHHHHIHDATLSSFASKLRPITIPTRQHDSSQPSTLSGGGDEGSSSRTVPISNIHFSSFEDLAENKAAGSTTVDFFQQYLHRPDEDFSYSFSPSAETRRSSYYCPNCCRKPSDQMPNNMYHFSGGGSPSSVASSAVLEPMSTAPIELRELEKKVVVEVKRERDRSFVSHHSVRETEGDAALDEAIAWARGKFWNQQASDITSDEILDYSEEAKGSKEKPSLN